MMRQPASEIIWLRPRQIHRRLMQPGCRSPRGPSPIRTVGVTARNTIVSNEEIWMTGVQVIAIMVHHRCGGRLIKDSGQMPTGIRLTVERNLCARTFVAIPSHCCWIKFVAKPGICCWRRVSIGTLHLGCAYEKGGNTNQKT